MNVNFEVIGNAVVMVEYQRICTYCEQQFTAYHPDADLCGTCEEGMRGEPQQHPPTHTVCGKRGTGESTCAECHDIAGLQGEDW